MNVIIPYPYHLFREQVLCLCLTYYFPIILSFVWNPLSVSPSVRAFLMFFLFLFLHLTFILADGTCMKCELHEKLKFNYSPEEDLRNLRLFTSYRCSPVAPKLFGFATLIFSNKHFGGNLAKPICSEDLILPLVKKRK
jgi:hypothetical protein